LKRFNLDTRRMAEALWWGALGALAAYMVEQWRPELWPYVAPLCVGLLAGIALMKRAEKHEDTVMEVFR